MASAPAMNALSLTLSLPKAIVETIETHMSDVNQQPKKLLELLEKYGRNLHSFMILEPGLSFWSTEDAAIAYADRGGYWVAVGGPLCAPERSLAVASEFREAAKSKGRKVVFFGVSQVLVDRLRGSDFDALQVGLAPVWDPAQWQGVVRSSEKLRNRLSKATRSGISVKLLKSALVHPGSAIGQQMVEIVDAWANQKALPAMGFMVTVELFQHAERRRYFVVESQACVEGFAVCVPIYGRNGWLVEDMMLRPDSPAGCSEALIDAVMRRLSEDGAEIVSLGMVALAGLDAVTDRTRKHPVLSGLLRFCSKTMGWLYNFEGLYRFRNKLKPLEWQEVYVVTSGTVSFWAIRAILMAFAQGWVPRFAFRFLGRWSRQWLGRQSVQSSRSLRSEQPMDEEIRQSPGKPPLDLPILLLAIICFMATAFAVVGYYQSWMPWWASLLLGFFGAFAGFTPVHEAVHGNVSRWKPFNGFVGHVSSLLLTGAFLPYCFLHREHHLHTNEIAADPDHWSGRGPKWTLPLRWLTQDIGYLRFYFSKWTSRPMVERTDLVLCTLLYVSLAIVTSFVDQRLCLALFFGWFIPARLALFTLAVTFSWLPHQPHVATEPIRATTVRSSPWLTWLLLGQNFHLVHHLDPSVPFYRLANRWREKRKEYLQLGAVDKST
jgi:fatty acid desaturase